MNGEEEAIWVLVQFKPNSDAIAVRNLERQGFNIFLPKIEQTQRVGDKFKKSVKPLFPGYLFAEVDVRVGGWRKINSTYGVSRIVTTAGKPTAVPKGLVGAIKARCDAQDQVVPESDFSKGDKVIMNHGPFADWVGEIIEMTADQRVWVLVEMMGRQTRIAVETKNIQSV